MVRFREALGLVVLAAVASGCGQTGDNPAAPSVARLEAAAGGNSGNAVVMSLTGGMNTPSDQPATVAADGHTRFKVYNCCEDEAFATDIALSATLAAADAGACTTRNSGGDLGRYLTQALAGRNITMEIDRTATVSTRHHLGVNWLDNGIRIRVKLKGNIAGYPELTVTTTNLGEGRTQYTFSQGAVNVERLSGGGPKQTDQLFCVNQDQVVVVVSN